MFDESWSGVFCSKGAENTHYENESLNCMSLNLFFLVNSASSLFLCGLIWLVQLVHYPSFHFVDKSRFEDFHLFHSQRISIIVIPVMIIELITSGILWWHYPSLSLYSVGFYLVILIWISTAIFSVPNHNKLLDGKSTDIIDSLVNTNWVRTILWTLKAVLAVYLLFQS